MSQQPPGEPEGQGLPQHPPQGPQPARGAPGPASQRPLVSQDERIWAMLCHLAAFGAFIVPIVGSVVGPFVVWQIKRDEYPLVDDQGKESLNFQLSMLLYGLIGFVLIIVFLIGLLVLAFVAVFDVVMVVIAAIQASNGKAYRYPLCIRFVK